MTKQEINNQTNVKKEAGFPPSYAFKADLTVNGKDMLFEKPLYHVKIYVTYLNEHDVPTTEDVGDGALKSEFVDVVYDWIKSS